MHFILICLVYYMLPTLLLIVVKLQDRCIRIDRFLFPRRLLWWMQSFFITVCAAWNLNLAVMCYLYWFRSMGWMSLPSSSSSKSLKTSVMTLYSATRWESVSLPLWQRRRGADPSSYVRNVMLLCRKWSVVFLSLGVSAGCWGIPHILPHGSSLSPSFAPYFLANGGGGWCMLFESSRE